MAKGYVSTEQVAGYMGTVFSPGQEEMCEASIGAAEAWIDQETHHAWLETGPVVEDFYTPQNMYLFLAKAPIVGVTGIVLAGGACGDMTMVEGQGYWVQSLRDGRIYMPYTRGAYKVQVTYEPNADPVPPEIQMAAMTLASHNMRMAPTFLDGVDPTLVQRYVVGGELQVEFRRGLSVVGGTVPPQVIEYLDTWRQNYVIV